MDKPLSIIPNSICGVSIQETGDRKFFLAFYIQKRKQGNNEKVVGGFALSIFAESWEEADQAAKYGEKDGIKLVMTLYVKDVLRQAIEEEIIINNPKSRLIQ